MVCRWGLQLGAALHSHSRGCVLALTDMHCSAVRHKGGQPAVLLQVDRYKQLLLKQRDIMIALTGRLNERDEQILTLQEELEAYDGHQK